MIILQSYDSGMMKIEIQLWWKTKLIGNLLHKTNMHDAKLVSTTTNFTFTGDASSVDQHDYRQIVGSLQYLSITRLDIAFPVNKVSQYAWNHSSHATYKKSFSLSKRVTWLRPASLTFFWFSPLCILWLWLGWWLNW